MPSECEFTNLEVDTVCLSCEEAIAYMEKYQYLPLCKHGNHVIDWARKLLAPPCGCSLTRRAPDLKRAARKSDKSIKPAVSSG